VWLSILLAPDEATAVLSLTAGVACAEAIEAVAPGVFVSLKWPNDLVIGERKVGGILVEAQSSGAIVGIGLNTTGPEGGFRGQLAEIATSIAAHTTAAVDPVDLVRLIIGRLRDQLAESDSVETTVAKLRHRDALRGHSVATEAAGIGVARGVNEAGALLLERPDGSTVPVVSGSVRALPRRA
jgi:BirA family biotin operon repressor/biotin-[acetyl-CoA-carboxylase] ligase